MVEESDDDKMRTAALWSPMILASLLIAGISIASAVVRASQGYPHDPWESIIVADAYRASVGLPVYTDQETDHATHIYGPLITYTIGLIFKWTGVNFLAGRLVALVATSSIIAALALIYFRRIPWFFMIAGVAMMMSLNLRLFAFLGLIKADMPALGFSLLALILMYQAMEKQRWGWYPLALVCFCVAYLFKQTAVMFTILPLLNLLLRKRGSIREWLAVATPPALILALIAAIAVVAPKVHYYMIVAVSRWPIEAAMVPVSIPRLLSVFMVWPLSLGMIILIRPSISWGDPKMRWLISACVGLLPGSLVAYSKLGAGLNSFLPSLLPLIVISFVGIAGAWETIAATHISAWRTHGFAWLMAVVMMWSALEPYSPPMRAVFVNAHGDEHYAQVVEYIRKLQGRVICPDDPTIPIVALRQAGRAAYAEFDANLSPWMPAWQQEEVLRADYVVVVDFAHTMYLKPETLRKWGFVPAGWGGADMGNYALWRKSGPPDAK